MIRASPWHIGLWERSLSPRRRNSTQRRCPGPRQCAQLAGSVLRLDQRDRLPQRHAQGQRGARKPGLIALRSPRRRGRRDDLGGPQRQPRTRGAAWAVARDQDVGERAGSELARRADGDDPGDPLTRAGGGGRVRALGAGQQRGLQVGARPGSARRRARRRPLPGRGRLRRARTATGARRTASAAARIGAPAAMSARAITTGTTGPRPRRSAASRPETSEAASEPSTIASPPRTAARRPPLMRRSRAARAPERPPAGTPRPTR